MNTDASDLAAYDDDGWLVICDRENPNAWIRSDTTTSVTDAKDARKRQSPP